MKVVITGPTGAIGMALVQKCIQEHTEVLAICHRGSKRISQIPKHPLVRVLEADLHELRELECIGEYDVFYHLAWDGTFGNARNDMYLQNKNVKYTLDAVSFAKRLGCTTFIGAGSQAEYGRAEGLLTSNTPTFPENGYGMAKLCAGQMSRKLCEELQMKHIWVRILSVYGPYDGVNTMISSTITKLSHGERASFTPGEQMWDYLYSEDAANALYLLASKGMDEKTYLLGSGVVRPLKDYIQEIYDVVCEKYEQVGELGIGDVGYSDKQVMYLGADITELAEDTGFEPKVSFEEGIRKMLEKE